MGKKRAAGGLPAKLVAFTLTEVLLAILIVGIIAALVLPAVVTKYQESALENAYTREVKSIEDSLLSLAVNENKTSFFDTMMYSDSEPTSYTDNAEKYMKKYLRVSKYCGESTGSGCFAKKYYEYKNNDKVEYTPEYKGACGVLKNGTSICIIPQVGGTAVSGIMDLNGAKGPNIYGKDLRAFTLSAQTRHGKSVSTQEVIAIENTPIGTTEDPCAGLTCGCGDLPECETEPEHVDPCTVDANSLDCCKTKTITSSSDSCCSYSEIKSSNSICNYKTATVKVTFKTTKGWLFDGCKESMTVNNAPSNYAFVHANGATIIGSCLVSGSSCSDSNDWFGGCSGSSRVTVCKKANATSYNNGGGNIVYSCKESESSISGIANGETAKFDYQEDNKGNITFIKAYK